MRKPSFLLKPSAYKTDKLYAILPDDGNGDMTVSGYVGNGTRVNPDGFIETVATDTPRLDHLRGVGVLCEPTSTNQATNSDAVSGVWTNTSCTLTANDTIAPDGTLNADRVADASTAAEGTIRRSVTVTDATAIHTVSFFVKFGNSDSVSIQIDSYSGVSASANITYKISRGGGITYITSTTWAEGDVTAGSVDYGNGWTRFYFVVDMVNTDTELRTFIIPGKTTSTQIVQEAAFLWLWGYQVEQSYFPTSYIPTAGTTVTRTYDELVLANPKANGLIYDNKFAFFMDFTQEEFVTDGTDHFTIYLGGVNGRFGFGNMPSNANERTLTVQNTDGTYDSYDLPSTVSRVKALFNCFGSHTDIWVGGVKVKTTTTGKYQVIATDEMQIQGQLSIPIKVHEMALFNSTFSDTEAKSITQ